MSAMSLDSAAGDEYVCVCVCVCVHKYQYTLRSPAFCFQTNAHLARSLQFALVFPGSFSQRDGFVH